MAARFGLRRTRDIVLADQRGTGRSNGFECRFYGPPGDPQSYFQPFLPPDKVRVCRDELAVRADLTQYTTAASVEDLEEIRAALGFDRINVMGGSYGTRLAMEYVRKYEGRVRSVVLDGPVPTSVSMPEDFGMLAQQSLDALIDECAATPACAEAFPDIRAEARAVFERLKRGPVTALVAHPDGGRPAQVTLTRDHVGEAIRYMMYVSRFAGDVPRFIHEAARGNFEPIATFLIRHRVSGTFEGLYLAITCTEDVPFVSDGAEPRDEPTYLGSYRIREQRAACKDWPRGRRTGMARPPRERQGAGPDPVRHARPGDPASTRRRSGANAPEQPAVDGPLWRPFAGGLTRSRMPRRLDHPLRRAR